MLKYRNIVSVFSTRYMHLYSSINNMILIAKKREKETIRLVDFFLSLVAFVHALLPRDYL